MKVRRTVSAEQQRRAQIVGAEFGIDRGGREGNTRVGKQHAASRKVAHGFHRLAAPGHEGRPVGQTDRDIGAEAGSNRRHRRFAQRASIGAGDQAQRRSRVGRTAAEAGGNGQLLQQTKASELDAGRADRCGFGRPDDEIVAAQAFRERPVYVEVERRTRLKRELVAEASESHKAAQLVIAVGAPSENLERQIELCPADLSERHQPAPQSITEKPGYCGVFCPACVVRSCADLVPALSGSPSAIFALSVMAWSSSGFSVSACAH